MADRIADLLARMTLPEKLGQMQQLHGLCPEHEELVRQGGVGSFLNVVGAEETNRLQRLAVEESRLGIPLLFGRDVIHGFRTIFPIPLGQAASFDPELVRQGARAAAREAAASGLGWTFAPMVDIARDPRWGRIAESLGEDPYLAALLGSAMVQGFQGEDPAAADAIAACAKHFVGYGAAEGGRDYNTTQIPEALLREVYLRPFAACCGAGALTIMSAFNAVNGIPATGNAFALRTVLREEWGWEGMVVSDWTSVTEMIPHGFCTDEREAAERALAAGVDMEMVSTAFADHAAGLLEAGALSAELIDQATARILRVKEALGLFAEPYLPTDRTGVLFSAEHQALARRAARESCVLLENDGILPLAGELRSLAVIGPLADSPRDQLGCWVMDQQETDSVTPLAALREAATGQLRFAAGLPTPRATETDGIAEAVAAAREADAAVLFLGEDAILSGEAHSRAFLGLPGAQQALLEAVAATGTPTIVVVMAGRPLLLGPVREHADALLYAWHPGSLGGPAIADLLFGAASPQGKLPVSFPHAEGQIPVYYNRLNTGRPAPDEARGLPVGTPLDPEGFCSNYVDCDHLPLYPFGYGLSYGRFEYADLKLSAASLPRDGALEVSVRVRNAGERAGTETVQLYIRDVAASRARPVRELVDICKATLEPGAEETVRFTLQADQLAGIDAQLQRVVEPGVFHLWVGGDSRAPLQASFAVTA
jgi:beta-glucosidase